VYPTGGHPGKCRSCSLAPEAPPGISRQERYRSVRAQTVPGCPEQDPACAVSPTRLSRPPPSGLRPYLGGEWDVSSDDNLGDGRVGRPAPVEPNGPPERSVAPGPIPTRLERLRTRAQRTRADIEARRAESASIDTAFEAVERDAQTGGGVLAAAVAFRLFMFLVPYALVVFVGLGLGATAAGQNPKDAAHSAGIGGLLASAVTSTSTMSLANRILALVLGGIALAFTARSLVRVLWIVHRLIWDVRPSRKPTLWAALILVGAVSALFGIADLVAWLGSQSIALRLLAIVFTIVTSAAAWFLASLWLPHEECEWWALLPGAALVGIGVGLLHGLTITYLAYEVSRKSSLYGAIGIALALLLWTYFAGRLLTASIAANAALWKRRSTEISVIPEGSPDSQNA